jgi:hypothetical protein
MVRLPRYLTAMIALAVAGGAPIAPARALVQPACVPCQYAGSEVIKIDWWTKKRERQARGDTHCQRITLKEPCKKKLIYGGGYCKWQNTDWLDKSKAGYCYWSAPS